MKVAAVQFQLAKYVLLNLIFHGHLGHVSKMRAFWGNMTDWFMDYGSGIQNLESPNEVRCFLLNKKFPDMVMSPKVTSLPSLILYEVSH